MSEALSPQEARSTILLLVRMGRGQPFTNSPPSWFTPGVPANSPACWSVTLPQGPHCRQLQDHSPLLAALWSPPRILATQLKWPKTFYCLLSWNSKAHRLFATCMENAEKTPRSASEEGSGGSPETVKGQAEDCRGGGLRCPASPTPASSEALGKEAAATMGGGESGGCLASWPLLLPASACCASLPLGLSGFLHLTLILSGFSSLTLFCLDSQVCYCFSLASHI